VSENNSETVALKLNRFLHRIDSKNAMIELADQCGCQLKRIRRSQNWLLTGNPSQLVEISHQLRLKKEKWISEAIDKALPKPCIDLAEIIKANTAMTVNQLIADTGCTLSEARTAIDQAEGLS